MEIEIKNTIKDIEEREWNTLAGTDFMESSYRWYKTVEESGMVELYYVFLKENSRLTAAACCFPYTHRMVSFPLELPFLQVRAPLGTSSAFFSPTPYHTDLLLKGLHQIQKREKIKRLSILGLRQEEFTFLENSMKGFTSLPPFQDTYMDLNFTDFDDYLSSLNASARRSIRKTLNRAEKRWEIKSIVTSDFSTWKEVTHRLQKYICEEHRDFRMHLTEQFYDALERNLKDNAELTLLFKDDTPIVFGLSINSPTISQHKAAGVDPSYREYQGYFLLYYESIRRAIDRNQKRIYFGLTTYTFKEKIGCKREGLYGFAKLDNPLLDFTLKSYMKISERVRKND
jgi:predicted N-acyltransferase